MPSRRDVFRWVLTGVALSTAAALGAVAWSSTLRGEYSVMDMGGDAAASDGHHHAGTASAISVTSLTADPDRRPDVRIRLVARAETVDIPGVGPIEGYTVNGTSPGPTIRARQGDLVEVEFVNESVTAGATLHWHGMDVPNAADGVAGVTQDAVAVGESFTYRFEAADAGTYWYHSHQVSHEQVERGLFGAIVIAPARSSTAVGSRAEQDVVALLHVYAGRHTLNGAAQDTHVVAAPGARVRVRVINTDQGTASVWSSGPFRVVATDGHEVVSPSDVEGQTVRIPAGGRLDVTVVAPERGAVDLHVGGGRVIHIGDASASTPPAPQPNRSLDLLAYGSSTPLDFDASTPDRIFDYVIGRRWGIIDGRPGNFWTINGHMFPDVPMFHVRDGEVVVMRLRNESGEVHPMHLHGHHVVVLSRNGISASGSPWIVDSLDVQAGERYEIAFVADNPGIWMDHCHTLPHAVDGLTAHVMYEGVTTPFTIGGARGNRPE
ncbi:multicopper oxidase family protein [Microbacterium sp. B2969]|uniref:Multicopper oxidase family protein n=1 Tax=Microbacterium alkaliflavum TaxID=3248839 RepID=A0ABW7Q393_9MICO